MLVKITCRHQKAKCVNMSLKVFYLFNFVVFVFFHSLLGCSFCAWSVKRTNFWFYVFLQPKHDVQKLDSAVIWRHQNGLCVLKLNLSGASIALRFNGPKRMESYKNEKSNVLTPDYKQINPTLFHISILNSFKKSQITTAHFAFEKHLNRSWKLQK